MNEEEQIARLAEALGHAQPPVSMNRWAAEPRGLRPRLSQLMSPVGVFAVAGAVAVALVSLRALPPANRTPANARPATATTLVTASPIVAATSAGVSATASARPSAIAPSAGKLSTPGPAAVTTPLVTPRATARPPTNLLPNPSFEANLNGWEPWQAQASRVALTGAPDGSYVALVTYGGGGTDFTIGDWPDDLVAVAGKTYTVTAWVRAASTSSAGVPALAGMTEFDSTGKQVKSSYGGKVILTQAGFEQVTTTFVPQNAGDHIVVFAEEVCSSCAGLSFYTDDFRLTSD